MSFNMAKTRGPAAPTGPRATGPGHKNDQLGKLRTQLKDIEDQILSLLVLFEDIRKALDTSDDVFRESRSQLDELHKALSQAQAREAAFNSTSTHGPLVAYRQLESKIANFKLPGKFRNLAEIEQRIAVVTDVINGSTDPTRPHISLVKLQQHRDELQQLNRQVVSYRNYNALVQECQKLKPTVTADLKAHEAARQEVEKARAAVDKYSSSMTAKVSSSTYGTPVSLTSLVALGGRILTAITFDLSMLGQLQLFRLPVPSVATDVPALLAAIDTITASFEKAQSLALELGQAELDNLLTSKESEKILLQAFTGGPDAQSWRQLVEDRRSGRVPAIVPEADESAPPTTTTTSSEEQESAKEQAPSPKEQDEDKEAEPAAAVAVAAADAEEQDQESEDSVAALAAAPAAEATVDNAAEPESSVAAEACASTTEGEDAEKAEAADGDESS
ncbi:hypothetical protein H696_03568 [Fonticula alba]|uniref:Uncharacterized protein n=1 Tax=Fonticula alba TaxID=691883 RepID=A0A058Z7M4_FONAL|nr:hypothetical protein H696_03568 [Fonticula alba]KCV70106.1 hypothetical protein H696_03568 [Fonticula alba]|eukprot:XP_009495712.1 hypothetical protein H696_03568 [Fonticula alba]